MFPLRRLPTEQIEEDETGRQEGRETDRQTRREKVDRTETARLEEMNGSLTDAGLEVT